MATIQPDAVIKPGPSPEIQRRLPARGENSEQLKKRALALIALSSLPWAYAASSFRHIRRAFSDGTHPKQRTTRRV